MATQRGKQPLVKALVYLGPGQKEWKDVPDPVIQQPTDVIVKIIATTICGTDLHILKGDVPAVTPGRILGHEGVGTITEIGSAVTTLAVGDRVILSCILGVREVWVLQDRACTRTAWALRVPKASGGFSAT